MKSKTVLVGVLVVLSAPIYAGVESVLYKTKLGACNIVATYSGAKGEAGVMVVRARSPSGKNRCQISKNSLIRTLNEALKALENKKNISGLASIFLANKLRIHRWMSDSLIRKSRNDIHWDTKSGKPKKGSSNEYVNRLLFSDSVLVSLRKVLKNYHYKITAVSCEKIIINKNKLPYDAMCWIKVKRELLVRGKAR